MDQLTGEERHKQLQKGVGDRPLDRFVYGAHPISGNQVDVVKQVRMPTFENPIDERNFRKLHMAACLRWLGETPSQSISSAIYKSKISVLSRPYVC